MSFQVELSFQRLVDRLDPLPDAGKVAEPANLLVLAVRAGQQHADLLGGVPLDRRAGQGLVGQHHHARHQRPEFAGYAQYTCVPAAQVIAFRSDLSWATLGAVPEMLQTVYGALTAGLDVQPGTTLLVRGGTSSVGMAVAILAKRRGLTVLSTTRSPAKADALRAVGVDHVLIDDGDVAAQVHAILPDGVDYALELVGTPTLPDTLRAARKLGVVCMAGMLSNEWIVPDFYPIGYIPRGVRLTGYGGDADEQRGRRHQQLRLVQPQADRFGVHRDGPGRQRRRRYDRPVVRALGTAERDHVRRPPAGRRATRTPA